MKSVYHVIIRCIVIEFYKQNAAFFGLLLLVFFGFIKASEHLALGSFLVASPVTLFYLYALWIVYAIKVILFVLPAINKKENQFLESFLLLPVRVKITTASLSAFTLLIPIAAYVIFLVLLAIPHGYYLSIASLVITFIIILSGLAYVLNKKLSQLPHETSFLQLRLFRKFSIPAFLFFIEHLVRKEIVLLFLTKLYVCALLIGTVLLYQNDDFDLRVLTTGVLFALTGNLAIVHKYAWFQHHQMVFFRNLPHALWQIFLSQSITFGILLLPEFIVLFRHYPIEPFFWDIIGILLFSFSIYNLMYALVLIYPADLSKLMVPVFWIVILTTFIILFSIHPLILGTIYLLISISIIYFRYDQYEHYE
jgi:hypothetical protein